MKGSFVRIMLVLVFLALVANVVVTALRGQSLISQEMVVWLVYGALVLANLLIAGAAVYFTTKTFEKYERSGIKWARRGFFTTVACTLLFGGMPWITSGKMDRVDAAVVLLAFGISNAIFAYSHYREYLRATGSRSQGEGRRRPHRKSGSRRDPFEVA